MFQSCSAVLLSAGERTHHAQIVYGAIPRKTNVANYANYLPDLQIIQM